MIVFFEFKFDFNLQMFSNIYLLFSIFFSLRPTEGLVDTCDNCNRTLSKYCCERDEFIWKENSTKRICCKIVNNPQQKRLYSSGCRSCVSKVGNCCKQKYGSICCNGKVVREWWEWRCAYIDNTWKKPVRIYAIQTLSFCSVICDFLGEKPYLPKMCSKDRMPEIEYVIPKQSEHHKCSVKTGNGIQDDENHKCIKSISYYTRQHHPVVKIIYITHGWLENREQWLYDMRDAIIEKYGARDNAIVANVYWGNTQGYSSPTLQINRSNLGS